ncbi:MarR family winged helix-turn-helix transcriptional regulator [Marichromatium gracile]|uniref:MarR family transcriptional regulator n=1 Tax=Marichromatium gracile TaxID=1048 RepID=A0ABR5VHZ7_MARGR|nr:MarR family transcriptional regulator [Marichromatium gracile]KXX65209.1 MarR family transcriptional regulator [Marichromatium gracile]
MTEHRQERERALTTRLVRLSRLYRQEVNRELARYGISDAQAVPVLHIARDGGGMRQHALAEEIGIRGSSLVRLLDQLCASGLVERRDDGSDRRAKTLHLTAAGEALAERVETALGRLRESLLGPVADDDLAAALRVFEALEQGLAARGEGQR